MTKAIPIKNILFFRHPKNKPIIIGGCYRSGTSLVRRILNSHSKIHCGPEVNFFRDFYNDYYNDNLSHLRFFNTAKSMLSNQELLIIFGEALIKFFEKVASVERKKRWANKNPDNILYLNEWHQLLGDNWIFIHVARNPYDTLASMKEIKFPLTIPEAFLSKVEMYVNYNRHGIDFGKKYPNQYFRLIYDVLVLQPEKYLNHLMQTIGEELEPSQLKFNKSFHQIGLEDPKISKTNGIHANSIFRWKHDLTCSEVDIIDKKALKIWNEIKYTQNKFNQKTT